MNVRLANPVYENLSGRFVVDPPLFFNKPHYPDSTKIVDGKDTTVYRKDAYYPANSKGLVHVDFYRHYQIVNVTVHPFLYNPVRQSLKRLVGGSIEVSFENKTSVLSGTAKAPIARVEAELRKTVANPEVLERYGTASVPSCHHSARHCGSSCLCNHNNSGNLLLLLVSLKLMHTLPIL